MLYAYMLNYCISYKKILSLACFPLSFMANILKQIYTGRPKKAASAPWDYTWETTYWAVRKALRSS